MSIRAFAALLAAGLIVRAVLLPLPGTIDVQTQKLWSVGAATDVTGIYGVGGTPPERRFVKWNDLSGPVDYPPMALLELAVVGRIYHAIDPAFTDSTLLTILVKLPGLLAEIVFVAALLTWGRRLLGAAAARWAALAFWLNPAVWFSGAALGYVDAQGAVPAALALLAAATGRPAAAGALIAVAAGTKPQTIYVLPIVAAVLLRRGSRGVDWRPLARAAAAGALATAVIVAPFVLRGAAPNMIQGVSRLLQHNMLSGTAPNIGWILTWLLRVRVVPDMGWTGALGLELRILQISRVIELGYPDPRPIATALTLAAVSAAAWRARRTTSLAAAAALAGWVVYAYSVVGIPVHENHFYPAVPLFAIAAATLTPLRAVFWTSSIIFTGNLYVFYGLSRGWPPLIDRAWTFIDLTVLLAIANVAVFVWATARVWRISAPFLAKQPRERLQAFDVIAD